MKLKEMAGELSVAVELIDKDPRTKTEARRARLTVDEWNRIIGRYEREAKTPYETAIYAAYKGMLTDRISKMLTWEQLKLFINAITTQMRSVLKGGWNESGNVFNSGSSCIVGRVL